MARALETGHKHGLVQGRIAHMNVIIPYVVAEKVGN